MIVTNICKIYSQALHFNSLADGTHQSIVIVLPITTEEKDKLQGVSSFALWHQGKPYAIMRNPEFFEHRKEERVSRQFGTSHPNHPYIKVSNVENKK